MTADPPREPIRAEDDPLLDWHSDARMIMDSYANDIAYRQITGTQLELLRLGEGPGGVTADEVAMLFERHGSLCAAAGQAGLAFTPESFVGFLTARVLLRADGEVYRTTTIGHGLLQYLEELSLPPKPL